jgi:hypothetical protein
LRQGDSDRVELQVQLGGQIARHPLGPLRFHHESWPASANDYHGSNT